MKKRILSWLALSLMFAAVTGFSRADTDSRVFGKIGENSSADSSRKVSLYIVFNGAKAEGLPAVPSGNETRFYAKVWDGLYLQATSESGDHGISGYKFYFSKDEAGQDTVDTVAAEDGPTLREIAASDFRSDDNFSTRPLKAGPGTPNDRGAFRVIHYVGIQHRGHQTAEKALLQKPFLPGDGQRKKLRISNQNLFHRQDAKDAKNSEGPKTRQKALKSQLLFWPLLADFASATTLS